MRVCMCPSMLVVKLVMTSLAIALSGVILISDPGSNHVRRPSGKLHRPCEDVCASR